MNEQRQECDRNLKNVEITKEFVRELLKDYPDPYNFVAYGFSDELVFGVSEVDGCLLSTVMMALSNFLCHVQYFGNKKKADAIKQKRKLEGKKYMAMSKAKDGSKKATNAQLLATVYADNSDIVKLEEELAETEEKALYYEKMPDRIAEHIQVIKYELRRREQGRQ